MEKVAEVAVAKVKRSEKAVKHREKQKLVVSECEVEKNETVAVAVH